MPHHHQCLKHHHLSFLQPLINVVRLEPQAQLHGEGGVGVVQPADVLLGLHLDVAQVAAQGAVAALLLLCCCLQLPIFPLRCPGSQGRE